ncbi:MAG: glycoside hydrolase family 95 protein, partial [Proteobacteria bacterium]|nr:glycoside hydrolase family 95 protein [Pseudomonadota bacterium]
LLCAATDYLLDYPGYKGRDYAALNEATLNAAKDKDFDLLLHEHLADYRKLFDRVSLRLDKAKASTEATDLRVEAYGKGSGDPGLEALFFQYGRYLLISSSRPGSLPANLQGKWNNSKHPPWASDYHFNINIQMIYWPAEVTNLAETHKPLLQYVKSLREPGRVTAQEFFNARGWVVHTMNNAFGYTAPGWALPWGYFPSASAWLGRHFWEHYAYSGDRGFLQAEALPMMEEVALFWLDYLSEDNQGRLASIPSYSPEHGGISSGASMDQQIVWDLFSNYLQGSEVLSLDSALTEQVTAARDALVPPQIGRWGQLQEWSEDRDDPENRHRHVSHLYAVYPGEQIGRKTTPDLAKAARVSLEARGDAGTGWSLAWKMNLWARLGDGERAYRLLTMAMRPAVRVAGAKYDGHASGIYSNLLSAHPPFQLDGNMGAVAGMAEMLLQSHAGRIQLLPALPAAWKDGEVRGLRARGGHEVSMKWRDEQLAEATVFSRSAGTVEVSYDGKRLVLPTRAGEKSVIDITAFR